MRSTAARSLGALGDVESVPALISLLSDEDGAVADPAAHALAELRDPRAVEQLREPRRASAPAWVLGGFGDARAVEPLCRVLTSEDLVAAQHAATSLGKLGDARAIAPLIAVVDRRHNSIPEAASRSLSELTGAQGVPTGREELIAFWKSWRRD